LVELAWTEDWDERLKDVREHLPLALVSVHLPMDKGVKQKALALGGPESPSSILKRVMGGELRMMNRRL